MLIKLSVDDISYSVMPASKCTRIYYVIDTIALVLDALRVIEVLLVLRMRAVIVIYDFVRGEPRGCNDVPARTSFSTFMLRCYRCCGCLVLTFLLIGRSSAAVANVSSLSLHRFIKWPDYATLCVHI